MYVVQEFQFDVIGIDETVPETLPRPVWEFTHGRSHDLVAIRTSAIGIMGKFLERVRVGELIEVEFKGYFLEG